MGTLSKARRREERMVVSGEDCKQEFGYYSGRRKKTVRSRACCGWSSNELIRVVAWAGGRLGEARKEVTKQEEVMQSIYRDSETAHPSASSPAVATLTSIHLPNYIII